MSDGGEPTADLLDALERVREVRGSPALFDALAAEAPERVRTAIAGAPRHPLRPRVLAWLAARGVAPPDEADASAALARHGITDVDAFVEAAHGREAALVRALNEARAERDHALRSANAYALVAALLAALAIGGWLVAVGGFPGSEETTPKPVPSRPAVPTEEP